MSSARPHVYPYREIDPGVRDFVRQLNEEAGVETFASCQGGDGQNHDPHRYICFMGNGKTLERALTFMESRKWPVRFVEVKFIQEMFGRRPLKTNADRFWCYVRLAPMPD